MTTHIATATSELPNSEPISSARRSRRGLTIIAGAGLSPHDRQA